MFYQVRVTVEVEAWNETDFDRVTKQAICKREPEWVATGVAEALSAVSDPLELGVTTYHLSYLAKREAFQNVQVKMAEQR